MLDMDESFRPFLENLQPKLDRLLSMEPLSKGLFQNIVVRSGVYILIEGSNHLFVGRSNNIRKKYMQHIGYRMSQSLAFAHRGSPFASSAIRKSVDLPLVCHPAAIRASAGFYPKPFIGPPELGVSGLLQGDGLAASPKFCNEIGGLLPIAPYLIVVREPILHFFYAHLQGSGTSGRSNIPRAV
jgi:hypothetical protein